LTEKNNYFIPVKKFNYEYTLFIKKIKTPLSRALKNILEKYKAFFIELL
jgi:hypothetical protein